jgi:hypothetical protein
MLQTISDAQQQHGLELRDLTDRACGEHSG